MTTRDHLKQTQICFSLATKAMEQGAHASFFWHLAKAYDALADENDYDLDIAIYAEEVIG